MLPTGSLSDRVHKSRSLLKSVFIISSHLQLGISDDFEGFWTKLLYAFLSSQSVRHAPPSHPRFDHPKKFPRHFM